MLNCAPRAVIVLLDVTSADELVQNSLSRSFRLQLLFLLLQMRLEALQFRQLLLKVWPWLPLRLPLRLHFGGRSPPLRADLEHVRGRAILELNHGQPKY